MLALHRKLSLLACLIPRYFSHQEYLHISIFRSPPSLRILDCMINQDYLHIGSSTHHLFVNFKCCLPLIFFSIFPSASCVEQGTRTRAAAPRTVVTQSSQHTTYIFCILVEQSWYKEIYSPILCKEISPEGKNVILNTKRA